MRNIITILKKQLMDTFKNKTILIQFLLFPIMSVIMERTVHLDGMEAHYFAKLFSIMYMGMAPLTSIASIIAEEKEKNTLRVLLMANVKPYQYLIGVGFYVWVICMCGAGVIAAAAGFVGEELFVFLVIMGVGILISIMVGATIGIFVKNQMMGTSLVMPVMLIFSFLPMLAMFNDSIKKVATVTYTQQMNLLMEGMKFSELTTEGGFIILGNLIVFILLFFAAYRKNGLE